ncbi:hypothetical protein HID58_074969 [Brassica napus]|uniref:Uncharacterized protein n=1 Tax=Brassica napus TaxID=3708 RepID=A0ABQ7YID2_BRANA|nr:hypothetical protein HID58_074969 [Brassica napus]
MLLQLLKPFSFHVFRNQDRFFSEALAPNYLFGNYRSSNQPYGFQRLEHPARRRGKFVVDGVLYEVLTRELAEDGVEVRVTPMRTWIIIRATCTENVLGKDNQGTSLVHKRFRFPQGLKTVLSFTREGCQQRSLCHCPGGVSTLQDPRFVMKSGAKGCEVIVCGKLRAARAKSMNFKSFESFNQNLTIYL